MQARTKGILRKGGGPYGSAGGLSIPEGSNTGNYDRSGLKVFLKAQNMLSNI